MRALYVASWPRCGNTMLRAVLRHCFGIFSRSRYIEHSSLLSDYQLADLVGAVDQIPPWQPIDAVKVHEHPGTGPHRTIYIMRDGRDAAVSYHRMRHDRADGIESMADVIRGNVAPFAISWGDFMRTMPPEGERVLHIRYETMLEDLASVVDRISSFIGVKPMAYEMPPPERFAERLAWFFRERRAGAWRDAFGPDEVALFESLHGDMLRAYSYEDAPYVDDHEATADRRDEVRTG